MRTCSLKTRLLTCTALSVAFLLGSFGQSHAAIFYYGATLSGSNEAPPNASPGTGTVLVTLDTTLNTMRVQATFSGLLGTSTAAHIHGNTANPLTGTAGVITSTPSFVGFPTGVTAGSMDQTYNMTLASSYSATFIASQGSVANAYSTLQNGLNSGRTYFNLHTTSFGGGEIRGFLVAVPEPSSMVLLGSIGAVAGWWTRQRRCRLSSRTA